MANQVAWEDPCAKATPERETSQEVSIGQVPLLEGIQCSVPVNDGLKADSWTKAQGGRSCTALFVSGGNTEDSITWGCLQDRWLLTLRPESSRMSKGRQECCVVVFFLSPPPKNVIQRFGFTSAWPVPPTLHQKKEKILQDLPVCPYSSPFFLPTGVS